MAENYPIVRLRNLSTNVDYYATTSNWSSNWVATGSKPETVNVVLPTLPADTYQLVVIANGINSEPLTFVVPNGVRRPSGTSASVANADQIAGGSAPVEPDADSNSSPAPFAPASSRRELDALHNFVRVERRFRYDQLVARDRLAGSVQPGAVHCSRIADGPHERRKPSMVGSGAVLEILSA